MSLPALLALLTILTQDPPPPLLPPPPYDPPPPAPGLGYRGDLGTDCRDRLDADGRFYWRYGTQVSSGGRIWLSLSSADFDAILEVRDAEGNVVATIRDLKGGDETGAFFTAAGAPSREGVLLDYTYTVTSASPGETGRWLVEDRRDGLSGRMFPEETFGRAPFPSACGPSR